MICIISFRRNLRHRRAKLTFSPIGRLPTSVLVYTLGFLGGGEVGAVFASSKELREAARVYLSQLRVFAWTPVIERSLWSRLSIRTLCACARKLQVIVITFNSRSSQTKPRMPWLPALVRRNSLCLTEVRLPDEFYLSHRLLVSLGRCSRLRIFDFDKIAFGMTESTWRDVIRVVTANAKTLQILRILHPKPVTGVNKLALCFLWAPRWLRAALIRVTVPRLDHADVCSDDAKPLVFPNLLTLEVHAPDADLSLMLSAQPRLRVLILHEGLSSDTQFTSGIHSSGWSNLQHLCCAHTVPSRNYSLLAGLGKSLLSLELRCETYMGDHISSLLQRLPLLQSGLFTSDSSNDLHLFHECDLVPLDKDVALTSLTQLRLDLAEMASVKLSGLAFPNLTLLSTTSSVDLTVFYETAVRLIYPKVAEPPHFST